MLKQSDFQERLKKRMGELELTQEALAEAAGVTQSAVQRWVNGGWPRTPQLPGLARALKWTLDELLTGQTGAAEDAEQKVAAAQAAERRSQPRDADGKAKRRA